MTPFAETIRDEGLAALKSFRKVKVEDAHNIQTHINSVTVLVSIPLCCQGGFENVLSGESAGIADESLLETIDDSFKPMERYPRDADRPQHPRDPSK